MMIFRSALVAATLFATVAHAAPPPTPTPTPAPAKPAAVAPAKPVAAPAAPAGAAVFPTAISPKYASLKPSDGRMKTCVDQYKANKAGNANGGLKWIQKGGGYWSECSKKLKG
jgi:hypothetical protein